MKKNLKTSSEGTTETMAKFNNGNPLVVKRLSDGRMGVVDEANLCVWVEHDVAPTRMGYWSLKSVDLPSIPKGYGQWKLTSIGGVSRTHRRTHILRAQPKTIGPVTLFAINAPTATAVEAALGSSEATGEEATEPTLWTLGDTEWVDTMGYVTEVIVHQAEDVDHAAAKIARVGAEPVFETPEVNAQRCLGVERLDRIEAKVSSREDDEDFGFTDYGLRRGGENWRFPWIPDWWARVPLTWDHLVSNYAHVTEVSEIPQPLRQYAARMRMEATPDPEEKAALRMHIPKKRLVSAGLTDAQSKQLIRAFYLLTVERVTDPSVAHALGLILYRYMSERGYTARWLGKYAQEARHVGNGDDTRHFASLTQYDPHRLPSDVITALCQRDGKLKGRGSKGSRSKYIDKSQRYKPKRRLTRSAEEEAKMKS